MATRKIASLLVDLVARTARFRGGLSQASRSTVRFTDSVQRSHDQVQSWARTLVAVATTGALAIWIKRSLEAADATAKTADKLGIATERLAGLRHAAEQTAGVTGSTLDTALQRMVRRVSEAADGAGSAAGALRELNLDAAELARLSPDQQFARIADAMQAVSTQGDRVRLAMRLFDTEGVSLVNTLRIGADGLEAFHDEAQALGIALDRVQTAKVEAANDSLDRVGKVITGIGQNIAVELAPFIEAAANAIAKLATESGGFGQYIRSAINGAITSFEFLASIVFRVRQGLDLLGAGALSAFAFVVQGVTDAERGFRSIGRFLSNLADLIGSAFHKMVAEVSVVWHALRQIVADFVQFVVVSVSEMLGAVGKSIDRLKGGIGQALMATAGELRAEFGGTSANALRDYEASVLSAAEATIALTEATDTLLHINVAPNEMLQGTADSLNEQATTLTNRAMDLERERLAFLQQVQSVVTEIQTSSQDAAQRAASASPAGVAAGIARPGDKLGKIASPDQETPSTLQQRLRDRLGVLRDFGLAEREQLAIDQQLKLEQLQTALANDLINKQEFSEAEAAIARDRESALTAIAKNGHKVRFQDAQTAAGAALELAEQFGDRAIGLQKVISLTQSGIAIATGIARAQELGFPANVAEALRVAAVGVKVANTIRSANRGTPSIGGASVRTGGANGGGPGGSNGQFADAGNDPTANVIDQPSQSGGRDAGTLVIPDGAVLDARQLAEVVNEAGRQGFRFDGIQLSGGRA